ncbi:MAG: hypothetical protein J7M25_10945 [Deltaproteobacteria bacterium]|nr:hypothetical protein [Deltaproteobacteria bacterium]
MNYNLYGEHCNAHGKHNFRFFFDVAAIVGLASLACGPTSESSGEQDGTVCSDSCDPTEGMRCHEALIQVCAKGDDGCFAWTQREDCGASSKICDDTGDTPVCVSVESCVDGAQNQDETDVDCGGSCPPCDKGKHCTSDKDCHSDSCIDGTCSLCKPNGGSCLGNTTRQCAGDGWSWVTGQDCGMTQKCDPVTGTCGDIPLVGNPPGDNDENVTGEYYKYARFTQEDGLVNYCFVSDVDSFDDLIYVHAVPAPCPGSYGGVQGQIDVYKVTLQDSDDDGTPEPDQHPDNPDNTGPIEQRVLTYVTTYQWPIGPVHHSEIYATEDKLYFPGMDEVFVEYDIASGTTVNIVDGSLLGNWGISQVGYDEDNDIWYFSSEAARRVYSYAPQLSAWVPEFNYPDMSGDHMDGMEFVKDPNTGIGYVYVSDMTSDYIGQYSKDATGNWQQVNLFHYTDSDVESVEGMGFGVLHHFWVGGWSAGSVYELGGGDLGQYIQVN